DVLELDDAPDAAVDLDVHSVLELVRVDVLGHRPRNLVDSEQILRERAQNLRLAVPHDDEILDPDSAESGSVDARFDRDDVAGGEHVARLLGQARILVDEEPDPVPEAVAEGLAE